MTTPEDVFQALADPTRRAMVERLARGPMSVARLGAPFAISGPAVTKHLRVLERAGLLRRERQGRVHVCHLQAEPLRDARAWLDEQQRFWEQSLDALERYFRDRNQGGGTNGGTRAG